MKPSEIRNRLKPWMLPIAMVTGLIFHDAMALLEWIAPWLIFAMLLLTFCKVNPREIRITRLSAVLVPVQILGGIVLYLIFRPLDEVFAQGMFICVFCPTATAAPVIVGMLGGSVPRLATFAIMSNVSVAALAPLLFTLMGSGDVDFLSTFLTICIKVIPLIISPLIIALLMRKFTPKVHHQLGDHAGLAFYIWAISLIITVGRSVSFIIGEPAQAIPVMIAMAVGAGVCCLLQFKVGRRVGARCGDPVVGGQALMQKNTVLALWMSMSFMNPLSSVAPAAYIAWQNTLNSFQIYRHQHPNSKKF